MNDVWRGGLPPLLTAPPSVGGGVASFNLGVNPYMPTAMGVPAIDPMAAYGGVHAPAVPTSHTGAATSKIRQPMQV
jgi:hypothetical protein